MLFIGKIHFHLEHRWICIHFGFIGFKYSIFYPYNLQKFPFISTAFPTHLLPTHLYKLCTCNAHPILALKNWMFTVKILKSSFKPFSLFFFKPQGVWVAFKNTKNGMRAWTCRNFLTIDRGYRVIIEQTWDLNGPMNYLIVIRS